MFRGLVLFLLLLSITQSISADETKNGTWWGTFSKKSIGNTYSVWAETQIRYDLSTGGMGQFLYRTGLLKKIRKHEIGLLYGFIQGNNSKEHRLALQHISNYQEALGINLSSRTRFEHRVLENVSESATRFRLLIRYVKSWAYPLVIWNEIFVNTKKVAWNGNESKDRNRFFIGTNLKIDKSNLEFGYLKQDIPRGSSNTQEHIFVTYFNF